MNSFFKTADKACAIPLKEHVAHGESPINLGEIINGNGVFFQILFRFYHSPHQVTFGYFKGLFNVYDGMGHDNAVLSNGQATVRPPFKETVKSHKYIGTHICFNDLCTMGCDIASLQTRINDITVFLGIGPFTQPGILQKSPLGNQHILSDVNGRFTHRISIQGG